MTIPGLSRLRSVARPVRKFLESHAMILLYHRVATLTRDPQWLSVSPSQFEEHLGILSRDYTPMSLTKVSGLLAAGKRLPHNAVVLTFDDGYVDNLYHAKPLLERFGVPATVFVATGAMDGQHEFWWDELEALLFNPEKIPPDLTLRIGNKTYRWELASSAQFDGPWHVMMPASPTPRHQVYRELAPLLREVESSERERILEDLAAWSGSRRAPRPSHRTMRPDEVVELCKGALVEVGAHTVSHPVLSQLAPGKQSAELWQSKARLETLLDSPVATFSYPFGAQGDYSTETVQCVADAGFACACANSEGLANAKSDRFQLPRFIVRDWSSEEFARRLRLWNNA